MRRSRRWLSLVLQLLLTAPVAVPAAAAAPPSVPPKLEVRSGHRLFLRGHAVGTQNYTCTANPTGPSGPPIGWVLYTPQATLFSAAGAQIATHFASPNPDEAGLPRPAWQHSRDTSSVWGKAVETSTDPLFVEPGAIPWLLVEVVGARRGPHHGGRLASARYVQRINTSGGAAPATGCSEAADLGKKAMVPYAADYLFYSRIRSGAVE